MILHPDRWHTLGSDMGYAQGFAAEAHNTHLSKELRNLAKILWMIYTGRDPGGMPSEIATQMAEETTPRQTQVSCLVFSFDLPDIYDEAWLASGSNPLRPASMGSASFTSCSRSAKVDTS